MNPLRLTLQILVPIAVLGGGFALSKFLAAQAPRPKAEAAQDTRPRVRVAPVERTTVQLEVTSQGNIDALRTVDLSAEVGGRIVATSPQLRVGGTFAAGDTLLTIDATDFELAIVQQEAAVARAELRLQQERAEAEAAVRAWRELEGERPAEPLAVRGPQIRDAEAELAAARALLQKRRLDQQRTQVKALFAGRVQTLVADLGQTVQPGQRLATLFDTSALEVRLPLPLDDAAFLDLPLRGDAAPGTGPTTALTADFGGRTHRWQARIVRVVGEVDRRTRQLTVVARIDADDGQGNDRPPLLVGMFVQARITGRQLVDVAAVPRAALHGADAVWVTARVAATEGRPAQTVLQRRVVRVLRAERDRVLIGEGLAAGENVCVTALEAAVEGMPVRVVDQNGAPSER